MTLAQQNNITEFPYIIRDQKGRIIYYEDSSGYWYKREFDTNGKVPYYENSSGYRLKTEYNASGNITYYEDFNVYWRKREYDDKRELIYSEDSRGVIIDRRPKKPVNHLKVQLTI